MKEMVSGVDRRRMPVSLVIALTAVMCGRAPESRQLADRFMELYYGQARVAEAVQLCSGAAKTRLDGELAAIQGVPANGPADTPHVSFRLSGDGTSTGADTTYVYDVDPRTTGVGPLVATVVVSNTGGRWLVTRLEERPQSP